MKKSGLMFGWIMLAVVLAVAVTLGIKNFNLQKELAQSQQSAIIAKQETQFKTQQVAQLQKKVILLSKKLKAAENHQTLNYKLKSGDTLYDLFGSDWQKVAKMNNIKSAESLPAGRIINFEGRLYRVKPGDSFTKLFGKNWRQIAWLNGFCPQQAEILPAGQILKVPTI